MFEREKTPEEKMWDYIKEHDDFTTMEIAESLGFLQKEVSSFMNKLRVKGIIEKIGSRHYFALYKKNLKNLVKG